MAEHKLVDEIQISFTKTIINSNKLKGEKNAKI